MRLTRGARYRLPPADFQDDDLVINIDPPKDEVHSINTPLHPAPSQHTDDDRFGRHRRHLLEEYGHDKLKFADQDDITTLGHGEEPIRDVYGWYEVSEWPGAAKRLKDTEKYLAALKGHEYRSQSDSSPDPFDDSEQDESFEPDDESPLLPSEAQTIEEDLDGAIYVPSPVKPQDSTPQIRFPAMGAFTPVKASQRRFAKPKSVKKQMPEFAARRTAYNENIMRGLASAPVSKSEPRRDSATEVLAKLNAAAQLEIEQGIVSPHSRRNYSKKERDIRRWSAAMDENIDPALLDDEARSAIQPRYLTQRTSHGSKKRKSQQGHVGGDDEVVISMPKKKRRSTRTSQVLIPDAAEDEAELDHTQPKAGQKVFPPVCDSNAHLSLWPQLDEAAADLGEGYQVRVRFIHNANHVLPKYRKDQALEIETLVSDLVKKLVYYLLTLPNWRATAVEKGLDELKSQAWNYILRKLKEIENIWIKMFHDLDVTFILPSADKDNPCPNPTAPRRKRNKDSTGNNHTPGVPSLTVAPRRKSTKAVPPPVADVPNADKKTLSYAAFASDLNILVTRQVVALLETIRFQTCIPTALSKRQTIKGTRQRRLYESNMRVAALAWQVSFFEGWIREIGRSMVRSVQKMASEGRGEMRYWKQEVVGGRAGEKEVVDLMTGVREPFSQWEKKHGTQEISHEENGGVEEHHHEDEEEEGAIAKSIRKAKVAAPHVTRRRYTTSHQRLQAAMNGSPPDKNLEEHNQLQDELRRLNRCSQNKGLHGNPQPENQQSPSLFVATAMTQFYNSPNTPQEQWEFAQDLASAAKGYNPRMGYYYPGGQHAESHVQRLGADVKTEAAYMPIDPALAAFDAKQQQMIQSMQQHEVQARYQRHMQTQQQQLPLPPPPATTMTTPPGLQRDRSATVTGDSEHVTMPTDAEIFATPRSGPAVVGLLSSPHRQLHHLQDPGAEQGGIFYPSSPLADVAGLPSWNMPAAGPSSPLIFDRGPGGGVAHEHERGREQIHEVSSNAVARGAVGHLPDRATLARLRDLYERQGRSADANAICALERGGAVAVGVDGRLVVHASASASASASAGYAYGNGSGSVDGSMVEGGGVGVGNVNGDFGANDLGETGESGEEARRRSVGDGSDRWKEMVVGGC